MSQSARSRDDLKRKQELVSNIFGQKLAHDDLIEAFRICKEDFDDDHESTASDFCRRLATTRPEVSIGKQTRLLFLRGVRQQGLNSEPQSKAETLRRAAIVPAVQHDSSASVKSSIPEQRYHARKITDLMGVY